MDFLTNIFQKISGVFVDNDDKKRIKEKQKKCHAECDQTAKKELEDLEKNVVDEKQEDNTVNNDPQQVRTNGGKSKRRKGLQNRRRKTRRSTK